MFHQAVIPLVLTVCIRLVSADCECGYSTTLNGTTYVFSDLLETDFVHLANISLNTDWRRQEYNRTAGSSRGSYGTSAQLNNDISNPIADNQSYAGPSVLGGDPGLQLWVRGGVPADGLVPVSEVDSVRQDMLWGSYRASMKLTDIPGTCGAFFWYFNDSQEIDMEFLSSQYSVENNSFPVNLVLQSPESVAQGYATTASGNYIKAQLPFNPSTGFHEYRIDFVPGSVVYYADGQEIATMHTPAVPSHSGHLILTQWSNGNPGWTFGPPATDAVMTVSYVKSYFNSSDPARNTALATRCKNPTAEGAICAIPDQMIAPDPNSPQGNQTADTYFFSNAKNKSTGQIISRQGVATSTEQPMKMGVFILIAASLTMMLLF